jgi:hypothetical protein
MCRTAQCRYRDQHQCGDRDSAGDHDQRGQVLDRDLDEEVRDAPEHRDEEEEKPGTSIHSSSLGAYRGKR